MNNISVLNSKIKRHTPSRRNSIAPDLASRDTTKPIAMIDDDNSHQRSNPRAKRVAGNDEAVIRASLEPKLAECVSLLIEQPGGGLEEAMVDVSTIEHLHTEAVIEEDLIVTLRSEIEATDSEDDLTVLGIGVDEVRGALALGIGVGGVLGDEFGIHAVAAVGGEAGVGDVVLVDGENGAADAGDRGELGGVGEGPGLAVVGADVGETLPGPAATAEADDALHAASDGHGSGSGGGGAGEEA